MKNDKMKNQYRVNEQIRARDVRVVSDGGAEVMPARKALELARQQELDLVEISPNAQPPVCRIVDLSLIHISEPTRLQDLSRMPSSA